MDEPFAALDAQTRDVLQLELLRIWDTRRAAMMFVTHSIDEAVLMGDRIVILRGRPSSIFDIVDVGISRPRGRDTVDSERFRTVRDYVWRAVMHDSAADTPLSHRCRRGTHRALNQLIYVKDDRGHGKTLAIPVDSWQCSPPRPSPPSQSPAAAVPGSGSSSSGGDNSLGARVSRHSHG